MLISVIIPAYNSAAFLAEAIASVRAQAYQPLEIIVVDDGSTDHTAQVVQELGADIRADIRYVYQQNQGPAAARNTGLALAQGELIAFLDADDLWPADKLAQQVPCLLANGETQVVWGYTQIQTYPATDLAVPAPAPNFHSLVGSILCRKALFALVGSFDATLRLGEDMDWFKRLYEYKVALKKLPALALIYRRRPGSLTYGKPIQELGWLSIIRRTVERRRASAEKVCLG